MHRNSSTQVQVRRRCNPQTNYVCDGLQKVSLSVLFGLPHKDDKRYITNVCRLQGTNDIGDDAGFCDVDK